MTSWKQFEQLTTHKYGDPRCGCPSASKFATTLMMMMTTTTTTTTMMSYLLPQFWANYSPENGLIKAVVITTFRLRFDRRSTPIRLQFDRAATIQRPT